MSTQSLTSHLLTSSSTSDLYKRATQSAFLSLAGQGRLPREKLSQWLSQDRLYAQAYVRFIGGLMSRIRLPLGTGSGISESLEWRLLAMLKGALDGILTELQFFEQTAKDYDLELAAAGGAEEQFGPIETTSGYIKLFDSFATGSGLQRSLLQGLVVLWATEKVYLDAWTYAREQGGGKGSGIREDLDGGALRKEFIPNWTSDGFNAFVKEIEECVDAYATTLERSAREEIMQVATDLWKEVLALEEGFWPNVNLKDVATTM
ncbi:hypothetical protein BJ170DRAFT_596964 [Xylariales sp. AK1849]|nr:hypothetical protein BJ170DRAFT_596964 [Xylariales sp. AK1849]